MPKTLPALLPALLLALLVGACFKPDETRPTSWTKPGATQDDIYADITSCRKQARAIIERDASIDADIASGASGSDFGTTATDLEYNLDAYSAEKRQRRLVAECMHGRGYALAGDG